MMGPLVATVLAKSLPLMHVRASIALGEDGVERPAPGAAPTAFRIWSAGKTQTSKGDHVFSRRSADLLLAAQAERGTLYSIDVDHMSLSDTAPPEHHRAVGWHKLEVRDTSSGPELWAVDVEWTPEIKASLETSPPGFRYFSPAYDVERKTGEVVGYLNTALTNNPATYQVTALASRAASTTAREGTNEERPMKYADCLAALMGDDEEKKEAAKAAMKAAFGEEDEEKKGDDEEKKESSKASDGEDEKKEEAKSSTKASDDEEEKKDSLAASDVAKIVRAELQVVRDEAERDRLITSRKDLPEKFLATLKGQPLAYVREALDALPVTAKRNPAGDLVVKATRGDGQGDGVGSRLPPAEKAALDERMGLAPRRASVRKEGNAVIFGVMTTEDAKQVLASKNGGK